MTAIAGAYLVLARWAEDHDQQASLEASCWREVCVEADGHESEWIVEVQLELV